MSSSSSRSSDSSVNLNKKKTNSAEKKKKKAIAEYSCDWNIGVVEILINVYEQYVDKKVEAGHSSHIHFECKEWMSMCDTFQAELGEAGLWFDEDQTIEVSEMRSKIMAMKNAPSPELEAIKNHNVELWEKWCKCCSLTENTGKSGSIQTQSSHKTSTSRGVKSGLQKLKLSKLCDDAFAILNDMDITPDVYMRAATMIVNTEDHYIVKEFTQLNKSDRLSYLMNVMLQN
ncbi:uncharacterized protein LOC125210858 [Salvia hispanica]|uniref:uncharacterized protein LOC125210858 n=1 Tax=Salvia hispanica TaxID=49212 RepID=UPI0020092088|nr:uncharacterized protein LOC125210858 [Salvia hispanica]